MRLIVFAAIKRRALTTNCIALVTYHFGTGYVQSVFKDVMFITRKCGQSYYLKDLEEERGQFLCGGSGEAYKERSKVMKRWKQYLIGLCIGFAVATIDNMDREIRSFEQQIEQQNRDHKVQIQKAYEERDNNPLIIAVSQIERGIASWYGEPEHGRRMANGEIYNMYELHTAAHSRLPLGTVVLVINLKNKRSVVVRINDRLPKVWNKHGRIVDMSFAAAEELQMIRDGLVSVELKVIKTTDDLTPEFLHECREIFK